MTTSLLFFVVIVLTFVSLRLDRHSLNLMSPGDMAYLQLQATGVDASSETILKKRIETLERLVKDLHHSYGPSHTKETIDLPSCAELMSRPSSAYADGSFITRHTVPHAWTPRQDGSRAFDLTTICTLKRYTAPEARKCLLNHHISFIGDSLTRYQVLGLAYYLHHGVYPPRWPSAKTIGSRCEHRVDEYNRSQCSPIGSPNICAETDWERHYPQKSWSRFFQGIGGTKEDGGVFDGHAECRCARSANPLRTENFVYATSKRAMEPAASNHKATSNGRTVLSFLSESGWNKDIRPLHGYNLTGCAFNGTCRMTEDIMSELMVRLNNRSYDWSQQFPAAIDPKQNGILLESLPPTDIAIYNRGLWGQLDASRAATIFPLLYQWTAGSSQGGRCFYKSTTGSSRRTSKALHQHEIGDIREATMSAGCQFFDLGHMTSDFATLRPGTGLTDKNDKRVMEREREQVYWDTVHFQPWVYEEMNNVLLNVLCNWKQ
jgi:hypothetical protein